jgi:carboxyl-terminal processing protease
MYATSALLALCLAPGRVSAQRASFEELQTFSAVLNHIRINYVDSVSYTPLVRAAIAGALSALDPHSRYVRLEASNILKDVARGATSSVGLVLDDSEEGVIVAAVGPGSPAERAGILALDRIVAVQDTSVAGLGSEDVEAKLAGAHESNVKLAIERGSKAAPQRVGVRLKRAKYSWPAVSASTMVDSITGYVRFNEFTSGSADEVQKAIKSVQKTGAKRVVLDLRGNPGGIVSEAISIASLFLPDHTLVFSTDGRTTTSDAQHYTTKNGPFTKLPLVMMIDGGSASASEALAAALQDHDRALLVGHRSFGKALVQAPFVLPAGDVLWLTIARVVSPSGRIIQRSYRDLTSGQYRSLAGTTPGAAAGFRSDAGRPLEAAGGVAPDVELAVRPILPPWTSIALDSAFDQIVIRDAAAALPVTVTADAWAGMDDRWQTILLDPFVALVDARIEKVSVDATLRPYIARFLAVRFAETRWGNEAAARVRMLTDSEVRSAASQFDSLATRLKRP